MPVFNPGVVLTMSGLGDVPMAMITVSTSSMDSEPSLHTGDLRPLSSGSPSSMQMHFDGLDLPLSSPMIFVGFVKSLRSMPSSLA